jgi:hypothetical protein
MKLLPKIAIPLGVLMLVSAGGLMWALAQIVDRHRTLEREDAGLQQRGRDFDATMARLAAKEADLDALIQKAKETAPSPVPAVPPTEAGTKPTASEESPNAGDHSTQPPPQEPSEVPVGRTVMVPIAEGYYSITVKSYKRVGTSVYLYLEYKNELPESVEFIMEARGNTMFDNLGNQYAASVASFVGGLNPKQMDILRGAFANVVLRFDQVSADASVSTALRTLTWWSSPSHPRSPISMGRRSYGDFENIPIGAQGTTVPLQKEAK